MLDKDTEDLAKKGICPKCKTKMEVRQNMFRHYGILFSGLVCKPCNTLWDNPDNSFLDAVFAVNSSK